MNKATARSCENCAKLTMQSEQLCDGIDVGVTQDNKKSRGLSAEHIDDTEAADSAKYKGRIAATGLQGGFNKQNCKREQSRVKNCWALPEKPSWGPLISF